MNRDIYLYFQKIVFANYLPLKGKRRNLINVDDSER